MKPRTVAQLLIPVGTTVLLFIIFWVLSFIVFIISTMIFGNSFPRVVDAIYDFFKVNIFQILDAPDVYVNTVIFWLINAVAFIVGEIWVTSAPELDE